jgi:hypothetical protein
VVPSLGRRLFGAGFLGFAGLAALQGGVWAYLTAAFFLVAGVLLVAVREPGRLRAAFLALAAVVFVAFFLRSLPAALAEKQFDGAWFNVAKWLAYVGGLVAIAGLAPWAGRAALGAFFIVCGVQHFLLTSFVATLVPAWIPGALLWTYFAGVALIAAGVGLNFLPTARLAALLAGGMIITWIVILHIPRALAAAGVAAQREEWNSVFEALTFSGLAWFLTRPTSPRPDGRGGRP